MPHHVVLAYYVIRDINYKKELVYQSLTKIASNTNILHLKVKLGIKNGDVDAKEFVKHVLQDFI
jgi:hypothetical protein